MTQNSTTEAPRDWLLECLEDALRLHGIERDAWVLRHGVSQAGRPTTPAEAKEILQAQSFEASWRRLPLRKLPSQMLPVIILRPDGRAHILVSIDGDKATVILPGCGGIAVTQPLTELEQKGIADCLLFKPKRASRRSPVAEAGTAGHWFFGTFRQFKGFYVQAAGIAMVANVLALITSFYSMQVYDRVIPHKGYETLAALTIGVALALGFDTLLRGMRSWMLESVAVRADYLLSQRLFRKLLGLRLEVLPSSPGGLANSLREYESVREFFTSATLATLTDVPFLVIFLGAVFWLGGPLIVVPLITIAITTIGLWLAQRSLKRISSVQLPAMSARHALLIETIEGLETIKAARGEGHYLGKWNACNEQIGTHGSAARTTQSHIGHFMSITQQLSNIALVCLGGYLAGEGVITAGAIVASTILNGRIMAPLGVIANLATRLQSARVSLRTLNRFMDNPSEVSSDALVPGQRRGAASVTLEAVDFTFPGAKRQALDRVSLSVTAGEQVAVLGPVGSGKSTFLRIAAGLYQPNNGMVRLDGLDVQQLHAGWKRKRIGFLSQDVRLFSGTLRDNLMMGEVADDSWFLTVMLATGVDRIAASSPLGYDMPVGHGGQGLSGGQRQLIAWARLMLAKPDLVLMDEPTSALDPETERRFIQVMAQFLRGRTLILVTHKLELLTMVQRAVVIVEGRITMDGTTRQVLDQVATNAANKRQKIAHAKS